MHGLVLWFNAQAGNGIIWCEDQGPLAFLGPDTPLPDGADSFECGDQLFFSLEMRDGVRYVREVNRVIRGVGGHDPRAIVTAHHHHAMAESKPPLRIVA